MQRETWRSFDFLLLGAVAILTIFGIAMIRSAMAGNEVLLEIFPNQIIFAIVGLIVVLSVAAIDYHLWIPASRILYFVVVFLLGLITLVGDALGGAQRWLDAGFFLIQPSELAKIVIILIMADFFARNQARIHEVRTIARSLIVVMGLVIWIFLQPDLSTSITVMVIWFAMLWVSGLRMQQLMGFAGAGLVMAIVGFPFLQDYQQSRIITFLFPDANETFGNIYNVNQALITIGSGGWFGQGYGNGTQTQLRFLKVRHTDFIFSAMSEEFGFIGGLFVIVMLGIILWRILRAARYARDTYGALICYGVATLIFFHSFVNIGMNLNLIPVTGLPLPFISYGGSSLLSNLLGIGLVQSVIVRHRALEFN